ncbi:hypothetical protein B4Q13_22805 [Lacticaseibacillus rhamnosus]
MVVGVDGSPTSKMALRWAADIAAFEGATIQAVSVCSLPPTVGWGYAVPYTFREDTEKALLFKLLDVEAETGMQLTESYAMTPGASWVSGTGSTTCR